MTNNKSRAKTINEYNQLIYNDKKMNLKESRLKKVCKMILEENSGKLLDIGCGKGVFSSFFIQHEWKTYGIDLDSNLIDEALKKGLNAVNYDVSKGLPFKNDFFNCVFAGEIIEHLVDTDFFIKEIYRVLKPGGCVIITTPNLISFENRIRILLGVYPIWVNYNLEAPGHVRAYTAKVLKQQLIKQGFVIEKHKGNWVPFIPQRFIDDVRCPYLAITGELFPNFSMDIIIKARKK